MKSEEKIRVAYHLATPVCDTMRGALVHLSYISIEDLWLLCRYYNCSVNEIAERFWIGCRAARGRA